jgi:predicted RNA polymerase sigma factor
VLQAELAACHARAGTPEQTDWARIVGLYSKLAELMPSPVIELNRAVALSMLMGPASGLAIVDGLKKDPALAKYHLLPTVRADLLIKLGRNDEARVELEQAIALTQNERERKLLRARIASLE